MSISSVSIALIACLFVTACAYQPAQTASAPESSVSANLRSASFITRDLDASVEFYKHYLGYKVLGRSEVTAAKSRQVVGAVGEARVNYVSLVPTDWSKDNTHFAGTSFSKYLKATRAHSIKMRGESREQAS